MNNNRKGCTFSHILVNYYASVHKVMQMDVSWILILLSLHLKFWRLESHNWY